ncbi:MAG TPA: hypothetical protein PLV59_03890 [Candidatus Dojkabacteria bacterium]|mgnify:CR=1 FL=1|nr:hypothetical protein [Candidatus Dojkabacteria bacterium]
MSITIVDNIKSIIKERPIVAVMAIAVVVLLLVLIYNLFFQREEEEKPQNGKYLIETPMQYEGSHSVVIPKQVYEEKTFPDQLPIFQLVDTNHSSDIDRFLIKIGKTGLTKDVVGDSLYSWIGSDSKLEYIKFQQSLSFTFSNPFTISLPTQFVDADSAEKFFSQFIKEYFGLEYEYTNAKISTEGQRIVLQVNRKVNDYPIYLQNHFTYTDTLTVDADGNVYSGSLTLFDYNSAEKEDIKLVKVPNLSQLMSNPSYPKDLFKGFSEDLRKILSEPGVELLDGADQLIELPEPVFSDVKSIELVYYYSSDAYKQLIPIYRLEAEGVITYLGKNARIPIVIYANALDPDRVYIESGE